MSVRHVYEYDFDLDGPSAPARIVRMVGRNKRVLEFGCGPGSITKVLTLKEKCTVTALELDVSAIEKVKPYCELVIEADLNSEDWLEFLSADVDFDVVVAGDVLEHLYDPGRVLSRMAEFVGESGYLVISLPHICHAAVISSLIMGRFDYRDWGLLDRTHIRFFGLSNIENLFSEAGLKIVEAEYVLKHADETEFSQEWESQSKEIKRILGSFPHSYIYQVVIKAVPISQPGDAISLVAPAVDKRFFLSRRRVRNYFSSWLGQKAKDRIRRGLGKIGLKV